MLIKPMHLKLRRFCSGVVFFIFCCFRQNCYRNQSKRICLGPRDVQSVRVVFFARFEMPIKPMHLKHERFCSDFMFFMFLMFFFDLQEMLIETKQNA